jgi:hypothetical protein
MEKKGLDWFVELWEGIQYMWVQASSLLSVSQAGRNSCYTSILAKGTLVILWPRPDFQRRSLSSSPGINLGGRKSACSSMDSMDNCLLCSPTLSGCLVQDLNWLGKKYTGLVSNQGSPLHPCSNRTYLWSPVVHFLNLFLNLFKTQTGGMGECDSSVP